MRSIRVNDLVRYQGLFRPYAGRCGVVVKIIPAESDDLRPEHDTEDYTVAFEFAGDLRHFTARSGMFDMEKASA